MKPVYWGVSTTGLKEGNVYNRFTIDQMMPLEASVTLSNTQFKREMYSIWLWNNPNIEGPN